ncbi:MAG: helix-turn-helix domain-containing protein [Acidimicrobiia bacterium]|nr:helix-turn-helix domain-containing protein [Acidimicrobiia bacterium]
MNAFGPNARVSDLIHTLTNAGGDEATLVAVAIDVVGAVTGAMAVAMKADGERWTVEGASTMAAEAIAAVDGLPAPASDLAVVDVELGRCGPALLLRWPRASAAVLVLGDVGLHRPFVELLATTVESLMTRQELIGQLNDLAEEQVGIARLLAIRDVDQLLLSTVNTANQLIDGDMAGVMLGAEDDLVMQCCVGNRSRQTEQLRFSPGQGVAGLVMQRGEPCKVDDYLESRTITHDFDSLARIEETKSALAAPLIVDGNTIGVLEVWRRRPSVFSDSDVARLVTLANLAAIAIDNARLHALKAENLSRLAETTDTLSKQLGALGQARSTQTTLSRLLLDGEGADAVTRAIATKLNAGVALLSAELRVISQWPRTLHVDDIVPRLRSLSGLDRPGIDHQTVQLGPSRWLAAQAVRGGSNHLGWFCVVLGGEPGIGEDLVISEAATVTALCLVIERAAEAARVDHRQSLVWNLIEGTIGQRRAAVDQARWLRVDVNRARRLVRGEIIPSGPAGRTSSTDDDYEQARRRVLAKVRGAAMNVGVGELVAARGNDLAIIVPDRDLPAIRSLVAELDAAVAGVLVNHGVAWGVSGPCPNLLDLDRANAEAISAVRAATRLGLDGTAAYEDLGVVRLIVSNDDGDLRHFLHDIIGPLLQHDAERNSELVDTLRAYFAADYSHADAAERLHIHHKTFGYRLSKIEALTGLDLRGHEGRMQADLALKLHDVATGS